MVDNYSMFIHCFFLCSYNIDQGISFNIVRLEIIDEGIGIDEISVSILIDLCV